MQAPFGEQGWCRVLVSHQCDLDSASYVGWVLLLVLVLAPRRFFSTSKFTHKFYWPLALLNVAWLKKVCTFYNILIYLFWLPQDNFSLIFIVTLSQSTLTLILRPLIACYQAALCWRKIPLPYPTPIEGFWVWAPLSHSPHPTENSSFVSYQWSLMGWDWYFKWKWKTGWLYLKRTDLII